MNLLKARYLDTREPFIIAEVGINHNGEINKALEMIDVASESGASAIKFQTFTATEFVSNPNQKFTYFSNGTEITESMLEMFQRYELRLEDWEKIHTYCEKISFPFFTTPQNLSDFAKLSKYEIPLIKIGSDDLTNTPMLQKYGDMDKMLILSSGMSYEKEIHEALLATNFFIDHDVSLLVCTSNYPTSPSDVNLLRFEKLKKLYPKLRLGFSDHTKGNVAAVMSVYAGANIFEKHFTLDHNLPGPDHWFSLDPIELKEWVNSIKTAWQMLGTGELSPSEPEKEMRKVARRSITAARDLEVGETIVEDLLLMKRPGTGIPPAAINSILGLKVRSKILKDSLIRREDLE